MCFCILDDDPRLSFLFFHLDLLLYFCFLLIFLSEISPFLFFFLVDTRFFLSLFCTLLIFFSLVIYECFFFWMVNVPTRRERMELEKSMSCLRYNLDLFIESGSIDQPLFFSSMNCFSTSAPFQRLFTCLFGYLCYL